MIPQRFVSPPEAFWKKIVRLGCNMFQLGDKEYIRASLTLRWPLSFWITILEPRRRRGWNRIMPWRVRCALAGLIRQLVWSRCTRCGAAFSLHELLTRDGSLTYFMSGSICHRDCEPSDDFKRMVAEMKLRQVKVDSFLHPQPPARDGAE